MAGKSLKGSKSHRNLKEAFAGESQANRRYLYFARPRHRGISRRRRAVQRHRALAYPSSTETMDGRTPASRHRLPKATTVYWRPWSECG